jgi:hypothetical protein
MINFSSEDPVSNCSPSLVVSTPKDSMSELVNGQHVVGQQPRELNASIPRPSMALVQTRHKCINSQVTPQGLSPVIEGRPVHNPTRTDFPAAGGDIVPPNNARTETSIPTRAAPAAEIGQLQDVFRDPLEIPGSKRKIYIYKHADACFSDAHKKRYPDIIDLFRQKLIADKALSKSRPAYTEFKLKMCGPDPENAQPSIVICHPLIEIKGGRQMMKTLGKKTLREQYEYRRDDTRPVFVIHAFFSGKFWMLGGTMKSFSMYMDDSLFIGAQLVSNDTSYHISTITCGVTFAGDNTIFALTSAHAFENNGGEKSYKLALSHDDTTSDSDSLESDDTSDHSSSGTDDEYDWDELEAAAVREREETSLSDPNKPIPLRHDIIEGHASRSEIKPIRVWGRPNDPKWSLQPNLDWALVEMPMLSQRSLLGRLSDEGIFIAPSRPSEAVGTVVVATTSGLFKGTLSSIPSYLAISRNSAALTEIWTLTLADHGMARSLTLVTSFPLTTVQIKGVCTKVTAARRFLTLRKIECTAT